MKTFTLLPFLAPLVSAHYDLIWPPPRSTSHSDEPTYPCGGVNTPQSNRTKYPLSGGPIQLSLGHTKTDVQVVLAVGNNPTDGSFTRVVVPTFEVSGVKNFCIGKGAFNWPSSLKDGDNATIQVISNGDPSGGLYTCTDVTFTSAALSDADYSAHCQNATGISVRTLPNAGNANGTASAGGSDDDDDDDSATVTTITSGSSTIVSTKAASSTAATSGATTGTTTAAANAATTTTGTTSSRTGAAAQATALGWGLAAVGMAAGVMAL